MSEQFVESLRYITSNEYHHIFITSKFVLELTQFLYQQCKSFINYNIGKRPALPISADAWIKWKFFPPHSVNTQNKNYHLIIFCENKICVVKFKNLFSNNNYFLATYVNKYTNLQQALGRFCKKNEADINTRDYMYHLLSDRCSISKMITLAYLYISMFSATFFHIYLNVLEKMLRSDISCKSYKPQNK